MRPKSGLAAYVVLLSSTALALAASSPRSSSSSDQLLSPSHHDDNHHHHAEHPVPSTSALLSDSYASDVSNSSSILATIPANGNQSISEGYGHGHDHGHGHGHGHGEHHKPQTDLNETDVHYWHHFPASYLAADFRLAKDQVIFGEELDDTWSPEDAGGHRTLVIVHAGLFLVAYFGLLPIGESNQMEWVRSGIRAQVPSAYLTFDRGKHLDRLFMLLIAYSPCSSSSTLSCSSPRRCDLPPRRDFFMVSSGRL